MSRAGAVLLLGLLAAGCAKLGRRASIIFSAVASELSPDRVLVDLKRSFIEDYQHRVTIRASFTVDAASGSPNPAVFDGDLHFAGRAPEIGLRLVAELKNAGEVERTVEQVTAARESRRPLLLQGAWRLWPEHAVGPRHEQGRPAAPLSNVNPDHVFEIHPITRLDGRSLLATLHPVEGYRPGSP